MLQHPTASLLPLGALIWAVQSPGDSQFPAGLGAGWAEMGDVTPMSCTSQVPTVPLAQCPAQPCTLPSPLGRRRTHYLFLILNPMVSA